MSDDPAGPTRSERSRGVGMSLHLRRERAVREEEKTGHPKFDMFDG